MLSQRKGVSPRDGGNAQACLGQGWLVWQVSAKGERKLGEGTRSRDEVTGAGRATGHFTV